MRLGAVNRVIRFLFGPLSLITIITLLNYYPEYKDINERCFKRDVCYSNCVNDNFPDLRCENAGLSLTYQGNVYSELYMYPTTESKTFTDCQALIADNPRTPYSQKDPGRMWRTHTCFKSCRGPAECLLGYEDDGRPECTKDNRGEGIYCVLPDSACENFV